MSHLRTLLQPTTVITVILQSTIEGFVGVENGGESYYEKGADRPKLSFEGDQTTFAVISSLVVNKSIP